MNTITPSSSSPPEPTVIGDGVATACRGDGQAKHLPNLDWLRLLLAVEVVWMHAQGVLPTHEPLIMIPAVPAFIALSGFLIPASFQSSRSWGHFARKRALRVVPGFILSFILIWLLLGATPIGPVVAFYFAV